MLLFSSYAYTKTLKVLNNSNNEVHFDRTLRRRFIIKAINSLKRKPIASPLFIAINQVLKLIRLKSFNKVKIRLTK